MTQPFLKYYEDLKDILTVEEINAEFNKLLDIAEQRKISKFNICDALWELADRQYHTYTFFDIKIKNRITIWLTQNWNTEFQFIEKIGRIAGSIGLKAVVELLKESLSNDLPANVEREIKETLLEIEPHIADPYYDLK
ncbi:MAG: hypothetical protein ABIP95_14300 [Pelobium sp.]